MQLWMRRALPSDRCDTLHSLSKLAKRFEMNKEIFRFG
jgi:hypothetical protein